MKKNKFTLSDAKIVMLGTLSYLAKIDYEKYHKSKLTKEKFISLWIDSMRQELDFWEIDESHLKQKFLKHYENKCN